jgi:hypothetical protein
MSFRVYILPGLLVLCLSSFAQDSKIDSLLKVADTTHTDTIRLDAWQELGTYYMEPDPAMGIQYGQRMLELSKKINDSLRIAFAYQVLGVCYDYKNDLDSCLYFLAKADTIHFSTNH